MLNIFSLANGRLFQEEIEALEAYGERYEEYRRQVPMFLPCIRRKTINLVKS